MQLHFPLLTSWFWACCIGLRVRNTRFHNFGRQNLWLLNDLLLMLPFWLLISPNENPVASFFDTSHLVFPFPYGCRWAWSVPCTRGWRRWRRDRYRSLPLPCLHPVGRVTEQRVLRTRCFTCGCQLRRVLFSGGFYVPAFLSAFLAHLELNLN